VLLDQQSGFLSQNTLTVVLQSVIVDQRDEAVITFKDADVSCIQVWNRVFDDVTTCLETYTAAIPWDMLSSHCGLTRTESANAIEYEGTIIVSQTDHLSQIRGQDITRDTVSPFAFMITFPKNVAVNSSQLAIFAPISVQSAIIKREFDSNTGYGHFLLYTSVEYPFILQTPSISVDTAGLNSYIIQNSVVSCPAAGPGACNVIYDIYVNASILCTLSGTYTAAFTIACQSGVDCPLQGDNVTIVFTAASNDFCGQFGVSVDLSISMGSYRADYSTPKDSFLQEQVMYFKTVTSSSKVQLLHTYLLNCSSIYGGAYTLLYSNGAYSVAGTLQPLASGAAFTVASSLSNSVSFNMIATSALFPLSADQSDSAVINCWVGVDYVDATGKRSELQMIQKRQVPHSSSSSLASSTVTLQGPVTPTTFENASMKVTSSLMLISILSVLFFMLF